VEFESPHPIATGLRLANNTTGLMNGLTHSQADLIPSTGDVSLLV
jgi:hypothetical protein